MSEKTIVRLLLLPCLIVLVPAQFFIGIKSIKRLGEVMIETGENLCDYDW